MELFDTYRSKYPVFCYHGYRVDMEEGKIVLTYDFEIEGLSKFAPKWYFPAEGRELCELKESAVFERLVFSIGMVELVSYWKITCSPFVRVYAGNLSAKQIDWWRELYYYGLGEFFYTNGIEVSMEKFMQIQCFGGEITGSGTVVEPNGKCLVPIGGGKDSVVSIELLKKAGRDICAYIINPRGATVNTTIAAGLKENQVYSCKRTLDKRMLELNARGFLNGHTPFSAIVAFSATLTAWLKNIQYIALSNEASANESTVKGSFVNHQYSKSFKFERDFYEYEREFIGSGTRYFSLLRPLSEFQIARYFAKCEAYHEVFRSCNAGSKEDKWCGHCPKCLFVYLMLSAFLDGGRVAGIFGTDMVNNPGMIGFMDQLTGVVDEKPFECVGSRDEVNMACCIVIKKLQEEGKPLPVLYQHYVDNGQFEKHCRIKNTFFTYFEENNLVPEEFLALVRENCCGEEL